MQTYESDILTKGLDVVFCVIDTYENAAQTGPHFSDPRNGFWSVLHLSGFTGLQLSPQDQHHLLRYGCGITTIMRQPVRRDQKISPDEFRRARVSLETRIREYAPRHVAFLGKRALLAMTGQNTVDWGRQPNSFADTITWVLPNPSGINRSFTLDELVLSFAELRTALDYSRDLKAPRPR